MAPARGRQAPMPVPRSSACSTPRCGRFAERPAYHNLGVTLRFADVERLSRQLAAYFLGLGLARGERVALMMPNLLQYPVALFAALRAGLTVVNTNPLYTARELRHQLADSGASAVVILENFAHVLAQVIDDTAVRHVITTAVADLRPFPKRAAVNFLVRRMKRMVPPFQIPRSVPWRQALARGADLRFDAAGGAAGRSRFPAVHRRYHGHTEGRDAHPCQHGGQLLQTRAVWGGLIEPGTRGDDRAAAALSRLLPDL